MREELDNVIATLSKMTATFFAMLPRFALGAVVLVAFFVLSKLIRGSIRRWIERRRRHHSLGLVIGRLSQLVFVALGVFVAAAITFPSIRASTIVQLLGIGSVAIGFAFRDILQNFLSGILILLTEPFNIGDQIKFGEYEGTVEDIQTRATFIKSYDGRRIVIPNSELYTKSVIVNTAYEARRTEARIGIGFGDDVDEAKRLIMAAMQKSPSVAHEPKPDVLVDEIGGSSLEIRARWWSKPDIQNVLLARDQVVADIKKSLPAAGIDLPFPTQQVLFHDQTEKTDGDRRSQREGWPARPDGPEHTRKTRMVPTRGQPEVPQPL